MNIDFIKEQMEITNDLQRKAYQAGYEKGRQDEKREWELKEKEVMEKAMAEDAQIETMKDEREEVMSPKDEPGFYQEY